MKGACARPWIVYVIGGMGSGKSSVSRIIEEAGVPVLDLDEVGHRVLEEEQVRRRLVSAFGEGILAPDGSIDRGSLAHRAFASEKGVRILNETTTQPICDAMARWVSRIAVAGTALCAIEVSAYDGPDGRFPSPDEVLAVVASTDVRIARAVAKGFEETDVRARIAAQASDALRRQWADVVLVNDGTFEELEDSVTVWLKGRMAYVGGRVR